MADQPIQAGQTPVPTGGAAGTPQQPYVPTGGGFGANAGNPINPDTGNPMTAFEMASQNTAVANGATPITPNPTLPSSITSGSLSSASSTPPNTQPNSPAPYNVAGLGQPSPYDQLTAPQQQESTANKNLQDLNTQEADKAKFTADQYKALGFGMTYDANGNIIPDAGTADLSAKLTALQNDAQAIPIRNKQAGIGNQSTYGESTQNNSDLYTNAVSALEVSSLIAAKNGQLTTAEHYVNNAVIQKFGPIEAQIAAQTKNLQLIQNSPEYSNAQKKQAAEAQTQLDAQKAALDQQKADYTAVQKAATDAAAQAKNFVATPQYPTVTAALTAIQKAKTPAEAQAIAAQTGLVAPQKNDSTIQEIGGRKVQIITDSSGKVISQTDLGSAATYSELHPSGTKNPAGYTSFTPTQQLDLQKAGETAASITQLEKDINTHGAQYVLDNGQGLSAATKSWIQDTYGVSPTPAPGGKKTFNLFDPSTW